MRYKKPIDEQLYIDFKSYEDLYYITNIFDQTTVKVIHINKDMGDALIWYDAEMDDRPYIIINDTIEYLDSLHTLIPINELMDDVCKEYGVKNEELLCDRRFAIYCEPRYVLFYILRTYYKIELQNIASMFNRKSHATVLSGIKNISNMIDIRPSYKVEVSRFYKKVYAFDSELKLSKIINNE